MLAKTLTSFMVLPMNFESIYLLLSIFLCFFIAFYSWYQEARGSKFFAVSSFFAALWVFAEAIKRHIYSFDSQVSAEMMRVIAVIFIAPSFFVFTYEYCSGKMKRFYLPYLLPLVSTIVFLFNPSEVFYDGIYFTEEGILSLNFSYYFWLVHAPYSFSMIFASLAICFRALLGSSSSDRQKLFVLFISTLIPFLFSLGSTLKIFRSSFVIVYAFPISFSLVTYSIFRFKLLKGSPIAYQTIFQTMTDGVIVLDKKNFVVDANPSFLKNISKTKDEVVGKMAEEIFSEWEDYVKKYKSVSKAYDEVEVKMKDEKRFFSLTIRPIEADGRLEGRIFIFRDITYQKTNELSLREMAYRDPLTQIANRRKLEVEIKKLIEKGEKFVLLYLDLNDFKKVNDTYGHEVGDRLLRIIAARVSSTLRSSDLLTRVGGDEFVVLVRQVSEIESIKKRVADVFSQPFDLQGNIFSVSCSIGFAVYPKDGQDLIRLLSKADLRMFEEKRRKKQSYKK